MRKLKALWMRLRGLLHSQPGDAEFDAELESHVELHTQEGIRAGLTSQEARRQALIRLGAWSR